MVEELLLFSFPVYLLWQGYMLARWKGSWKIAASIPLLLFSMPIIFITVKAFIRENNVWPVLLLIGSPAALAILIILSVAKVLTPRRG